MAALRLVQLSRTAAIALRALVELAREPGLMLSVAELARRQQLPQPMLEQILLRLRRQGLVEARRGRQGGYRLALQADRLPLARVLQAVERPLQNRSLPEGAAPAIDAPVGPAAGDPPAAIPAVTTTCSDPAACSDLAAEPAESLEASAGQRVEQQLRRRLERLVQLELQRLTLAELLYDQRSWEASLGPQGGVILS